MLAVCRVLPAVPVVFLVPEIGAAERGRDWAELGLYTATILGTGIVLVMLGALAVTPLTTVTGARWFVPLRKYFGVAAAYLALFAVLLTAILPAGGAGVTGRLTGDIILLTGTIAVALFVPLLLTSTGAAQKWLGRYWRRLHQLTYVLWAVVLWHLYLIDGPHGAFLQTAAASIPLAVLRIRPVRRWWVAQRKAKRYSVLYLAGVPLALLFCYGAYGLVAEEVHMGLLAITARQLSFS